MNRKLLCLMTGLMIVTLTLTACGGSSAPAPAQPAPSNSGSTPVEPTSVPEQPKAQTPQELGNEIGQVYVGALEDVTKLVASKPPAADVKAKVADLKEKVIQQLVELGQKRDGMSEADRQTVTNRISMALSSIGSAAWYTQFSEAVSYYNKEDSDLSALLASFNIIGQYAQFELLKQQEPKEAERLGIK
jgi:hypothetical protein